MIDQMMQRTRTFLRKRPSSSFSGSTLSTASRTSRRRCQELGPWISAYADQELEGDQYLGLRCRVEAHLEICDTCSLQLSAWKADTALLRIDPARNQSFEPDPWFVRRFALELEEDGNRATPRRVRRVTSSWGLRALTLTVTAAGLVLGIGLRSSLQSSQLEDTLVNRIDAFESSALATGTIASTSRSDDGWADFEEFLRPTQAEARFSDREERSTRSSVRRVLLDKDR